MKKAVGWALLGVLAVVINLQTAVLVQAAINEQIPFYGTLQDTNEVNLSGTYDMVFRFYDSPSGGTLLDTSTHTAANGNAVTVTEGEFGVLLGSGTGNTLNGLDFNSATIYVGITIGTDSEMTPRERLGSAAYSFNTDEIDGYDSLDLLRLSATNTISYNATTPLLTINQQGTGDILNVLDAGTEVFTILDGGNVGIGDSNPTTKLSVAGDVRVTGAFRDTSGDAGTVGQILLTTGSGTNWTATSSLGFLSSTAGNWTGTLDGQEGSFYLANSFSTTSANFWESSQTTRSADNLSDNSIEDLLDVAAMTENVGDLLFWNGTGWSDIATSSLGITATLSNNSVTPNNILTTGQTDEYCLTYESTGTTWEWQTCGGGGGSLFTDAGAVTYLTSLTDKLAIGTTSASTTLTVAGDITIFDGSYIYFPDSNYIRMQTDFWSYAIGQEAGQNNAGYDGFFVGDSAGFNNTASEVTAIGWYAGYDNTGDYVNMLGSEAGYQNSGIESNMFGNSAGYNNSGDHAQLFGYFAGYNNTGNRIVAIGRQAGRLNTGDFSVLMGDSAGYQNAGDLNVIIGDGAGSDNLGYDNVIIGSAAGYSNSGTTSIMIGTSAGGAQSGLQNILIGNAAGEIQDGNYNVMLGYAAGVSNVFSDYSNLIGYAAGDSSRGDYNNFIGFRAAENGGDGNYNDYIGYQTGRYLNATSTVAIGGFALYGNSASDSIISNTTAIGYGAGQGIRTGGNNNIFIGYNAGDNLTTGDNNIVIGYDIDAMSATLSNRLNIGNLIFGTGIDGTGTTLSSGNVGIGTTTPLQKLQVRGDIRVGTTGSNGCVENYGGGVIGGTCSSDEQLKTNIADLFSDEESVLERLVELTPVTYNWNEAAASLYFKDTNELNIGLVAQDVEEQFPELVSRNKDEYLQVNFTALPFYLLGAIKELYEKVTGLEEKTKEIDELRERIERLEAESGVTYQEEQTEPPVSDSSGYQPSEEAPVDPEPVVEEVADEELTEPVPAEDSQVTTETL